MSVRREVIKNKIRAVGKMARVFSVLRLGDAFAVLIIRHTPHSPSFSSFSLSFSYSFLSRQERETVMALKGLSPSGQLPTGVLSQGSEGVQEGTSHTHLMRLLPSTISFSFPILLLYSSTALEEFQRLHADGQRARVHSFDEAKALDRPNERMPPRRESAVSMTSEPASPMEDSKFTLPS